MRVRNLCRAAPVIVIAVTAAVTVSACGGGSGSSGSSGGGGSAGGKQLTIGFIVKNFQVPFWLTMRDAAQKEAKAKGVNLIFEAARAVGDNKTQVNDIDNFITRQVDAIAVAPNESAAIVPAIKRATAAGIPVLAVDTATDPTNVVKSFVATDSVKAGVLQGTWAKSALKGKTPVIAAMHGQIGSQVDTDRWNGFLQGFGSDAKQNVIVIWPPAGSRDRRRPRRRTRSPPIPTSTSSGTSTMTVPSARARPSSQRARRARC